jgi:hypothetical protein
MGAGLSMAGSEWIARQARRKASAVNSLTTEYFSPNCLWRGDSGEDVH